MTTTDLLESLSAQLSAKATTNYEPMLRMRDVLEVLGAAMGTEGHISMGIDWSSDFVEEQAKKLAKSLEMARPAQFHSCLGSWESFSDWYRKAMVDGVREILHLVPKPIDVEAAKAEARREAYVEVFGRWGDALANGEEATLTEEMIRWENWLREACEMEGKPATAEKKAVDVEALPAIGSGVLVDVGHKSFRLDSVEIHKESGSCCGKGVFFYVKEWAGHWHIEDEGKTWFRIAKNGGAR